MLIRELLEAKPISNTYDTEHYGVWTVEMSQRPVRMPAITGDTAQYVAKVTHKRTGQTEIAAGSSQSEARERALSLATGVQANDTTHDISRYGIFMIDFNAEFMREYWNKNSSSWYRFSHEGDQILLIRASQNYVQEFGEELRELDFSRASIRTENKGVELATPHLGFSLGAHQFRRTGLSVKTRYMVKFEYLDGDKNEVFSTMLHSRIQGIEGPGKIERLNFPAFTTSASKIVR
jgi:hypothetical protein